MACSILSNCLKLHVCQQGSKKIDLKATPIENLLKNSANVDDLYAANKDDFYVTEWSEKRKKTNLRTSSWTSANGFPAQYRYGPSQEPSYIPL